MEGQGGRAQQGAVGQIKYIIKVIVQSMSMQSNGEALGGDWTSQPEDSEVAGFVNKTFEILGVQEYQKIIYWSSSGFEFVIRDVVKFQEIVLPRYFRHKKINSFVRQLNMYGFHKMKHNHFKSTFRHEHFQKDRSDLLPLIRRKPKLNNGADDSGDENKPVLQQIARPEKIQKLMKSEQQKLMKSEQPTMCHEKWANLSSEFLETTRMINMSLVKVSCNDLSDIVNNGIPEEDDCASIQGEIEQGGHYQFEDPSLFFCSRLDL